MNSKTYLTFAMVADMGLTVNRRIVMFNGITDKYLTEEQEKDLDEMAKRFKDTLGGGK